ncbi:HNH endonuclease signature motif containing protein [Agreia bicolorata]|nr:HNH endonuclease signature motif containing protein [Agreia bicolorata]
MGDIRYYIYMEHIFDFLRAIAAQVSNMHATTDIASLSSEEVTTFMRLTGQLRQEVDRALAWGSAEINQRSRRELGSTGLAKTEGYVNPQSLIAALMGSTKADARKIDHLGKSLMDASPVLFPPAAGSTGTDTRDGLPELARPWFAAIADSMRAGDISPDRFEALRAGLGEASEALPADALAAAAERILQLLHPEDSPETVYRDAANARAFLDRAGVAEKERQQLADQEARVWTDREGMVHLRATFAPEDGAWFINTLNLVLGPRIGGPRFVHGKAAAAAKTIEDDARSTEQIRASVLVDLLKAGALTDKNAILSQKRPAVQIVVTAAELTRPDGDGIAFIQGTGIPVSMNTVDRLACDTGAVPIVRNSDGSPLDLGREVRLYTRAQRLVIAALQGGCARDGCDAPAAFCEVHHITHWCEGGKTAIDDGILLCRFHHMQLHNQGHRIIRVSGQPYEDSYYWVPSKFGDIEQTPIKLRFRGVAHHNAQATPDPSLRAAAS